MRSADNTFQRGTAARLRLAIRVEESRYRQHHIIFASKHGHNAGVRRSAMLPQQRYLTAGTSHSTMCMADAHRASFADRFGHPGQWLQRWALLTRKSRNAWTLATDFSSSG